MTGGMRVPEDVARARCWVEVDLKAIAANYLSARAMLGPGCQLIPVLKGNAYGCGALPVAHVLAGLGARLLAVATVGEALEVLRATDIGVLVMGPAGEAELPAAIDAGAALTAYSPEQARLIGACAQALNRPARVHFKLDTGLHRLGYEPETAARDIIEAAKLKGIVPEGLFTHLALHSASLDERQFEAFDRVAGQLEGAGLHLFKHVLDSIGLVRYPDRQYGAVRVGAWLYGVCPVGYEHPERDKPVARFMARVAQVRSVRAGELIGYDDDHPLGRDALVATLSVGFADGCPRFVETGEVEVRGRRARVLGRVCMDQMMVDVTAIEGVRAGDVATLLGGGITIEEYARRGNFNRNEALARIGPRVPRVYY
ncbi:MAG: alanine racemase [Christensenellaceae bacterium]|nr:alanine racemase [Christensenellaceae bacterium]